jgi:hypothetical protein
VTFETGLFQDHSMVTSMVTLRPRASIWRTWLWILRPRLMRLS